MNRAACSINHCSSLKILSRYEIYTIIIMVVLSGGLISSIKAQSFKGTVLDRTTDQPIPFASVYFVELETGTNSDSSGTFLIKHPPHNEIHVQISFIGYQTIYESIDLENELEKVFYLEYTHVELEEIVVSVPIGKLQGENVVSVDRRKMSQLMSSSPITLSEAISAIPGVDQSTTGIGIGKPVIRGLSGNRVVTYAQGIRIENQQWGDEHGLGVGEVGIESVEVIKGPASLLYGSDAIGGVLYFVDERYSNHNTVSGYFTTRFLTNTLGSLNSLGFKLHKENLKFNLFGNFSSNTDYQIPDAKRVFNTRFNEQNIKSSLGFNKKKWIANIRYSFLKNNFGIADSAIYVTQKDRNSVLPYQTIDNHNLSMDNTLITGKSRIKLVLGFTDNLRKEYEDDASTAALNMSLRTYSFDLKWHSPTYSNKINLIVGSQGMLQKNINKGEEILIPDASTTDFGGFLIGNYNTKKFHLQGGIRGDYRLIDAQEVFRPDGNIPALKRSFGSFNFSFGAAYSMGSSKIRGNLATGFRAPNTSELLSNGIHEGTNRYEIGNAELASENATQTDVTYEYQSDHFSLAVNPFYNYIQNYIFLAPVDTVINNAPAYAYQQTNAALFGGELGLHYHPHGIHWLHLESNLSSVFAKDRQNTPLPMIPAVKLSSELKIVFSQNANVHVKDVFLQHIYRFKQDRIGQFESPTAGYQVINIGANMVIRTKGLPIEISSGIKNLLNTKYIDHLSRFKALQIPNPGINFYIGLKVAMTSDLKKGN